MTIPSNEITATSHEGFFRSSTKYEYRVTCLFRVCERSVHYSPIDHFSVASRVTRARIAGGREESMMLRQQRRKDEMTMTMMMHAIVAIYDSGWFATGETRRQLSAAVISAPLNR